MELKQYSSNKYMKKIFLITISLFLSAKVFAEEIKINDNASAIELEDIYNKYKENGEINIYFQKNETIIKEESREEYLEHLVQELKSALKKGKKLGKIRRVEGNLAEIDKGAIHKVREMDVYKVYNPAGQYKGKLEIGAIADAVSIGEIYSENNQFLPEDKIKYLGRRRFYKLGMEVACEPKLEYEKFWGFGAKFEYTFRGGYSLLVIFSNYYRQNYEYSIISEINYSYYYSDDKNDYIYMPFGINKYFNYPGNISPFIGLGSAYEHIEFSYTEEETINGNTIKDIRVDKKEYNRLIPFIQSGVQIAPFAIICDIGVRGFYETKLSIKTYDFERTYNANWIFIPFISFSMGW